MSDNIPFDIQMEIIKKVSHVKSLVQFRSVSKQWRSFIDSSEFIKGYGARHTQPYRHIVMYRVPGDLNPRFCLVDDNIETLQVQEFVVSPLLKQCRVYRVVGACHGLLCLSLYRDININDKEKIVIWNPSIGKSFGIVANYYETAYGFGVCPVTKDPTILKMKHRSSMPWHVEVFTLSSGVWNVIPSSKLPRESIQLNTSAQVVIDRFIYWGAYEQISADDGRSIINHMLVSFDLITKEFKVVVVDLPRSLIDQLNGTCLCVSKLRESLVVYEYLFVGELWVMEHDSSFRKLFTIEAPISKILGFRKYGEPIFVCGTENTQLAAYDPYSQQIKNLGISGVHGSFFMEYYEESLLLLDHSDSHIYSDS